MNVTRSIAAALFLTISAAACANEGPVERAGKKLDDAADNVSEGESPFKKKGAAERVGESIDEAVGNDGK